LDITSAKPYHPPFFFNFLKLTATAAGKKLQPNIVAIILLLFLIVVVSVEKFH
jgi:hypothetical protein